MLNNLDSLEVVLVVTGQTAFQTHLHLHILIQLHTLCLSGEMRRLKLITSHAVHFLYS